jgi:hypothetical protein
MNVRRVFLGVLIIGLALGAIVSTACKAQAPSATATQAAAPVAKSASYDDLVQLFKDWREFMKPKMVDGVPDYTPAAMKEQFEGLKGMRARLAAIDPQGWPIPQQADYLLVKAEMNGLEFDHRVIRPWARDPGFYAVFDQFQPTVYGAMRLPRLPIPADRVGQVKAQLEAVPRILARAKVNLTEPAADFALLAIDFKKKESARLAKLAEDLAKDQPDLSASAVKAREAVDAYQAWLEQNRSGWAKYAGVGIENYDWFVKNVWLLPYTWNDLMTISQRELERAVASLAMERHHNRNLPPLKKMTSEAEYVRFFNESQKELLEFLKREDILTIPPYMTLKPITSHRFTPVTDYFANVQERDPLPLMAHDFVGHGPDMAHNAIDKRVIRGADRPYHIEGVRAEAYATGMEEALMHLGLLDKRPRSRELLWSLLAFRAARAISDLKMHANQLTYTEAFKYVVDNVPDGWVPADSPVLWGDLDLYLRQPCYGVSYLIGSVQVQQLFAQRAAQLGPKFDLKALLDQFTEAGWIPITLVRWEITGLDDQVKQFWK